MVHKDTISLLKECNAGVKMGVTSIDEVLDNVKSDTLLKLLTENKEEHQQLGSKIHELLNEYGESGKEPSAMAKGMSWVKTNVMLNMHDSDHTIADVMTDGCNMGVKSLNRYLNKYEAADQKSKALAKDLITLEQRLTQELCSFL
ncbi:MAG: hypothetical protein U0L92_08310 [Clostridia bacterium]|nr:hypothetical protein [Clostridia bacterium]